MSERKIIRDAIAKWDKCFLPCACFDAKTLSGNSCAAQADSIIESLRAANYRIVAERSK